jgi:hypothetical protein
VYYALAHDRSYQFGGCRNEAPMLRRILKLLAKLRMPMPALALG